MLGGYYLGQLYLGISGSASTLDILMVQDSFHNVSSDNINIVHYQVLATDGSLHSITSDNITLAEIYELLINNGLHGIASNNIAISILYELFVNNTKHSTSSQSILKIFNWDEMNKFFGTYVKDFGSLGDLEKIDSPDTSIYVIKKEKLGTFNSVSIDNSGTYIKENNKQGIL